MLNWKCVNTNEYICCFILIYSLFRINIGDLELVVEKSSRLDIAFIQKHGPRIYRSLYESLEQANNTVENFEAIYTTLALLCVELSSEETVTEMLRLVVSIQVQWLIMNIFMSLNWRLVILRELKIVFRTKMF